MNKFKQIEDIIRERLKLQSTQRALYESFGVFNAQFNEITTPSFILKINSWPIDKKKHFIYTIAGKVNMAKTFRFYEELKEKYNSK